MWHPALYIMIRMTLGGKSAISKLRISHCSIGHYPMISAYICGLAGMRNCPNFPMSLEPTKLANFNRCHLNKYSHGITTRTPGHWKFARFPNKVGLVGREPMRLKAEWVHSPQDPPYWELCEFPLARGSCYILLEIKARTDSCDRSFCVEGLLL